MLKDMEITNIFNEDLLKIKDIIRTSLSSNNTNIGILSNNLAATEGKMIRAILVLISGSFGTIDKNRLFHISAGIELLHLATLVHDDIVDNSNLRRGKKTINSTHGVKSALFMGDYLFSEANVLFSKYSSLKSMNNISETIKFVCESEINQFFSTYRLDSTIKDYLRRINGKCASLISLSLSIGAFEGNADIKIIKKLKRIGYLIGMAFQLTDDILDITSPKVILGKPSENDIKEGIYTFPVLYEINKNNFALIKALKEENFDKVLELLKCSSGLKKSKEIAERYSYKALTLVDELPCTNESFFLKFIIETLLNRTF